jgi:hypothetical protein
MADAFEYIARLGQSLEDEASQSVACNDADLAAIAACPEGPLVLRKVAPVGNVLPKDPLQGSVDLGLSTDRLLTYLRLFIGQGLAQVYFRARADRLRFVVRQRKRRAGPGRRLGLAEQTGEEG